MTYTEDQYTALKAAYASGALSVKYGEQSVTYHSRVDMRRILDEMEAEFNPNARRTVLGGVIQGVYCKGLK